MGYIKVAPLCMYDCTRWVLRIIRGCHISNNLHRAEKFKLPMVAPSRVCSSPHTLSAAPLPTIGTLVDVGILIGVGVLVGLGFLLALGVLK